MKNRTLLSLTTLVAITAPWGIQAQAAPETIKTLEVECSSQTYFTENECDICQDGGDVTTDAKGAIVNAQEFSWENSLTGKNQNFYKSGQPAAEIKTNIGTVPTTWDQIGLDWSTDVVFEKVDIQNIFSLEAGKTIKIKTIADKTNIPITGIKTTTSPYLMLKIPISYYELAMGASSQGDKKTTNYCVSYTPKITTTGVTNTTTTPPPVTTTTAPTTPPPTTTTTTTPTIPVAPIPKPTTTTAPTTPTTPPPPTTTTVPPKQIATPAATDTTTTTIPPVTTNTTTTTTTLPPKPIANTATTGIVPTSTNTNTAIPSYNPSVPLNSAGNDPKLSAASKVASGPAENMYIFMTAVLLSAVLYPKMRKMNNKI